MPGLRLWMIGLFCLAAAFAQQEQEPTEAESLTQFRATVDVVVAPTIVRDRDGNIVHGLQPSDFRLFDNGKEQNIQVDVAFQPISMVIAIQANANVESILPKIQKISSMIQPILLGEAGEVAVIAFDHRLDLKQDFTKDPDQIEKALKSIKPGSSTSRLVDAVHRGAFMLRSRPSERRRVLLLISETRDYGSEGRAREALLALQVYNISVYTVNMSRIVTTLSARPQPSRPNPLPPAARGLPSSVPATPTAVQATFGTDSRAEFIPLMVEMFRNVKAIFKDNPAELFTKGTGGREYAFTRQRGLEDAISAISQELRSQYLISYSPNNKEEGGFHEITVQVPLHRGLEADTRPGYWMAARFE
jgi:VWFA-related protein